MNVTLKKYFYVYICIYVCIMYVYIYTDSCHKYNSLINQTFILIYTKLTLIYIYIYQFNVTNNYILHNSSQQSAPPE